MQPKWQQPAGVMTLDGKYPGNSPLARLANVRDPVHGIKILDNYLISNVHHNLQSLGIIGCFSHALYILFERNRMIFRERQGILLTQDASQPISKGLTRTSPL
jgi:hypothetical protein